MKLKVEIESEKKKKRDRVETNEKQEVAKGTIAGFGPELGFVSLWAGLQMVCWPPT